MNRKVRLGTAILSQQGEEVDDSRSGVANDGENVCALNLYSSLWTGCYDPRAECVSALRSLSPRLQPRIPSDVEERVS